MHGFLVPSIKNIMESLRIITIETDEKEEGSIAINTKIQGNPTLEYFKGGEWIPLDNLGTINRMSRLDDFYTQLRSRNWGIGPRFSEEFGELYLHPGVQDSPIPKLSGGIKISNVTTSDELTDDMNKEIDIYYDSLISARNFLEGSSVVDLWEYPVEYSGILNLVTLPIMKDHLRYTGEAPIIKLSVAWIIDGNRKVENLMFTPWSLEESDFKWSDFQSSLGDSEVIVEFHDGCIRVFPGSPKVTECIIHHCVATYDRLL